MNKRQDAETQRRRENIQTKTRSLPLPVLTLLPSLTLDLRRWTLDMLERGQAPFPTCKYYLVEL